MAVVTMLLATKSSPLYPLNDWVDSNAFFTVGKSIFNGKVLYRDIFDHKGPILHFIHGFAWLISHESFFGVWIFEIIACYFTLLFSYRILELYTDRKAILLMPVFATVLYTSNAMCHGDSAEEFCLPLLMYAVYLIVRSLKEKEDISSGSLFLLGVTSGVVLWIKYTMLGFYVGWVILPMFLALKNKNWKYILRMCLCIGGGVLLATVPVLVYFLLNGALYDLWDVYFYTNIFKYARSSEGLFETVLHTGWAVCDMMLKNPGFAVLLVIGGIWALRQRKLLLVAQVLLMLFFAVLLIYAKSTIMPYYALIFCGFAIFGLIPVYSLLSRLLEKWDRKVYVGAVLLACVLILPATWLLSGNTDMLRYEKEDLPQYQFAQIIDQKEDATVLNYGFLDGGFHTTTGTIPSLRYFCIMNVDEEEAREAQDEAVRNGSVDFVITRNEKLDSDRYEERMVSSYLFENKEFEFTLYERKAD